MAATVAAGCSSTGPGNAPARPEPGVVFSFPYDGQIDVPIGVRVTVAMSEAIASGSVQEGCTGGGAASGAICLRDEEGNEVAGDATVVGARAAAIQFVPDQPLAPGRRYQVFLDPNVIDPAADNLALDAAVTSFVTRDDRLHVGEAAHVLAVSGEDPEVFAPDAGRAPRYPVVEFATFRLVMSEPIDPATVVQGDTVQLVRVDEGSGAESPVPATLLFGGVHLVIDPDDDLEPGALYRLRLSDGLRDQGGEPVEPTVLEIRPTASRDSGDLYDQRLAVAPGVGDADYPTVATYSPLDSNTSLVRSLLLGDNKIEMHSGTLEAKLAHPDQFTTVVPVVARKGQRLVGDSVAVALGGVIPTGIDTGDVELRFLTDTTGVLRRNSFRDDSVVPDNERAPLEVRLAFDAAMSVSDSRAGGALDQTILGVEIAGVAFAVDGSLELSNIGVMELQLLGTSRSSVEAAFNFRVEPDVALESDTVAPSLLNTVPDNPGTLLSATDGVILRFSEPMAIGDGAVTLVDDNDVPVDATVTVDGAVVVVTPRAPLSPGLYDVVLGDTLTDVAGNRYLPANGDPTRGTGKLSIGAPSLSSDSPAPPLATAIFPGAPCATSAGACTGGLDTDVSYQDFELPANLPIEVSFDQPVARSSLTLGTACGSGAVRVEETSGDSCVAPVPGNLVPRDRGLAFVPAAPWTPGKSYRVVLHGGGNASCDAGELCGVNGLAFNSDPLNGAGDSDAGGPDLIVDFAGADATSDTLVATSALPRVDQNGNGRVDGPEAAGDQNLAITTITGTSGIVTSANFVGDCDPDTADRQGCLYLSSDLAVKIGEVQDSCSITTAAGTTTADHCVPIDIEPPIIYGTSMTMDASVLGLGLINNLETGKVLLRVLDDQGPVTAYIIDGPDGAPELVTTLHTYMDAPDLTLLGGLSSHDLHSKELTVFLRGPLEFREDGRIVMSLSNETDVVIEVGVSALGIGVGGMTLTIPAGQMRVDLMSQAPHGGEL